MTRSLFHATLAIGLCLGSMASASGAAAEDAKPSGAAEVAEPYLGDSRPAGTLTFPPGAASMRVTPLDILTDVEWQAAVRYSKGAPFGFAKKPDPALLQRYYPPEALANGIKGRVRYGCVVTDAEGRLRCLVLEVDPPGMMFELYGLLVLQDARSEARDADGNSTVGRAVSIPVLFAMEE